MERHFKYMVEITLTLHGEREQLSYGNCFN